MSDTKWDVENFAIEAGAKPVDWDLNGKPIYSWTVGWAGMNVEWLERFAALVISAAPTPPAPEGISMEPVAHFCNPYGRVYEVVSIGCEGDEDVFPLYSAEQLAHPQEQQRLLQAENERLRGERDELLEVVKESVSKCQYPSWTDIENYGPSWIEAHKAGVLSALEAIANIERK